MTSFGYSVGGLVDAAAGHEGIRGDVEQVISTLVGLVVESGVLGELPEAAVFVQALDRARDVLGRSAGLDAAFRSAQATRTSTVARLGQLLSDDTAAMAAAATPGSLPPLSTPGSILEQMAGSPPPSVPGTGPSSPPPLSTPASILDGMAG